MSPENRKYRILIVDDDESMRLMIGDFLQVREGYSVLLAQDGEKALEVIARQGPIDLVLSDINMPVMKGFELLHRVRESDPKIKRVLMTGYNVEEYLELAIKYDIGNIFIKSVCFNFSELAAIIGSLLHNTVFGIEQHFALNATRTNYELKGPLHLEDIAHTIAESVAGVNDLRRLELVVLEVLTNAVFYGIRNESSEHKEAWDYNIDLPLGDAIAIAVMQDSEKYGISIVDKGGKLKKQDVLYWLHRQITPGTDGVPMGIYDSHGRGFFIARKFIDRVIINIERNRMTEIILVNYLSSDHKGIKPLYINEV